jgi:replicative DNA helicase
MAKQKNSPRPTITTLPDFGKVPPQANDMEEAVLGAVMLEKEAVITILDIQRSTSENFQSNL